MKVKLLSGFVTFILSSSVFLFADLNTDPWNFNVYALHDIGTAAHPYNSDFQGIAGSGNDTFLQSFSLNLKGGQPAFAPYSLYSGGQVSISSSEIKNGGIEAGGNITSTSSAINGNLSSGGNLLGKSGTINGNVILEGTNQAKSSLTIKGTVSTNQTYQPIVNQTTVQAYFKNASSFWGSLSPTANYTISFGTLTLNNLVSGRNVVDISLGSFNSLFTIQASGPADAFIVFNIKDSTTTANDFLHAASLNLTGGLTINNILLNLPNASSLDLMGGTYTSILAPLADLTFSSGVLQGNLIAQNLYGNGQVNSGFFIGFPNDEHNFVKTPEPSTYLACGSMLTVILILLRKRNSTKVANQI